MLAAAQRIYDRLVALGFGTTDLQTYLGGIGDVMFQEIEDLASDGPLGQAGWSSLLDINRVPNKALPWLGQFVGVQFPAGLTPADQKIRIQSTDGWKRGTPAAIAAAPLPYLSGTKTVILRERDPAAAPNDPAYGLTVITKRNETPFLLKTAAAPLTVSGNEITDAVRAAGVQGDGRSADSSFGIYETTTNLAYKNAGGDPIASSGFGAISGTGPTKTDLGGGWFRLYGGTGTEALFRMFVALADLTNGATYACSIFWKNKTGNVRIDWSDVGTEEDVAGAGANPLSVGGGVTRSYVASARGAYDATYRFFDIVVGSGVTIDIKWAQVEQKTFPTPYSASAAARPAARVQAPASYLDPTQGAMAFRVSLDVVKASGYQMIGEWTDNPQANQQVSLYVSSGNWRVSAIWDGSPPSDEIAGGPATVGDHTVLLVWTATQLKMRVDGNPFTVIVRHRGVSPTAWQALFQIGARYYDGLELDGRVKWAATFTGVLTDADGDALYALGDTEPTKDTLSPGAMLTAVFPFNTTSYQDLAGPDPKVLAALMEQKPAGIILNYQVLAGADYEILLASNPLYSNVFANFLTYQGVINNVPGT